MSGSTGERVGGGRLCLVRPATDGLQDGNGTTAERWSELLRGLGWRVEQTERWSGDEVDVLVALHARKSHGSILRFHRAFPDKTLVVCGTGTDLYTDVESGDGDEVRESLGLADRIVVLQRLALDQLPAHLRERARVIHQSVPRPNKQYTKPDDRFQVVLLANVRPVKDPLTAARAATLLPADSRVRIVHAGGTIDEGLESELTAIASECAAYERRGPLPRDAALDLLGSSHLCLSTSRHEGGANVLSEALAYDVPIVCTSIPGSLGMLEETYPGKFPVGDAQALADLLVRVETDDAFRTDLVEACRERAWLTDPRTEHESWRRLFEELRDDPTS